RAAHGAVLYGPVARVGGHDRSRDGRVRARRATGHRRTARDEGPGRDDGGGAARGRHRPRGGPAVRELDASADARSSDVHAGNGPARECVADCGRARRKGSGVGHLRLAERTAHLATLAALADNAAAAGRAVEILRAYTRTYWGYANQDNVLGPSRLFFSTYLESIWIGNFLAAAALLRACGRLEKVAAGAVSGVAEEAANLIGEFDEGFSNRQTWNNAALAAIAVWFEDEDLAKRAIEGPTGLLEHLLRGFGRDGMWYEGENYHLFALRGLLTGAGWARLAGVDIVAEPQLAQRVEAALLAPTPSALPDFTFPARKDSRCGVSLAQPAYLELWEVGFARLGMRDEG